MVRKYQASTPQCWFDSLSYRAEFKIRLETNSQGSVCTPSRHILKWLSMPQHGMEIHSAIADKRQQVAPTRRPRLNQRNASNTTDCEPQGGTAARRQKSATVSGGGGGQPEKEESDKHKRRQECQSPPAVSLFPFLLLPPTVSFFLHPLPSLCVHSAIPSPSSQLKVHSPVGLAAPMV